MHLCQDIPSFKIYPVSSWPVSSCSQSQAGHVMSVCIKLVYLKITGPNVAQAFSVEKFQLFIGMLVDAMQWEFVIRDGWCL